MPLYYNSGGTSTGTSAISHKPAITGYTGGGATNLDGIVTAGSAVAVGQIVSFVHSTDGLRFYKLTAGTTAESSPDVIRPDDYAGGTNEFVWLPVL